MHRPRNLVVQIGPGPASIVALAAQVSFGTSFLLDAHSGVFLSATERRFYWLLRRAFRRAAAVLIHNDEHVADVRKLGGNPFVLEDPMPRFHGTNLPLARTTLPAPSVFYPCSWAADEPLDAVLGAARLLPDVRFYISGRPRPIRGLPGNVFLTGFLSDSQYLSHLTGATLVLALTLEESTVLCAAHEAIAFAKPLITSDTRVLAERFGKAALLTKATPSAIAETALQALSSLARLAEASAQLRESLETVWDRRVSFLDRVAPGFFRPRDASRT